jgi:predicted glycogen debranching enzyme
MPFIHFSKEQLHDPHFSLEREIVQANSTGAYCSSSLLNCNTRKYHGLLVTPQPQLDENQYVLLSALDETIFQGAKKTQLATHHYPNTYYPEGYFHLEDFSYERIPQWIIKEGDLILKKEIMLAQDEERVFIRYTIIESKNPLLFRFDPFLAFRTIHTLSKSNNHVNRKTEKISNGIKLKMYSGFSNLFLQFSKQTEFIATPDWHYNNEYKQERERGYEYREDLYCPGYFKLSVKKGDQLIFSAGLTEVGPRRLKTLFESQLKKHIPIHNFKDCLEKAARQFVVNAEKRAEIIAGFHWFGRWGRDTFIALPGLTLATKQPKICKAVLDTMLKDLKDGLFPNCGSREKAVYNTADASLWFFWALQQYAIHTGTASQIWKEYGVKMKSILGHYRKGTGHNIHMMDNGLLFSGEPGVAVTWMDAVVDGKPVTPRVGMTVELNTLWYNAIRFSLETAALSGDRKFIKEWESLPFQIESSFREIFWDKDKGYLADYVNAHHTDWSLRPNQIFAASLPYSPIDDEIKRSLIEKIEQELLTPRGLRTLSPDDKHYKGSYHSDQRSRDLAYHQGTVWPWLLGHFAEAYIKLHSNKAETMIQLLYENFAPAVLEYGIGTIAEIYEGDKPHNARGAISQAWSVAELLRIRAMITENQQETKETSGTLQTVS